jgi:hypothetical protein
MTDDKDITRRNAEMVARYQAIMDGAPDDRPADDPAAQREARAWLASRCQGTDSGPINIHVGNGDVRQHRARHRREPAEIRRQDTRPASPDPRQPDGRPVRSGDSGPPQLSQ